MNNKQSWLFFSPSYNELSLFSMSFACILLMVTTLWAERGSYSINISNFDFSVFVICFFFLGGLILSFYNAFTDRIKTPTEKKIMLLFAVLINGFSGIWGGTYLLEQSSGVLTVIPVLNIASGFILIMMLRSGEINESNISDEQVSFAEVFLTALILSIVFYCCHFIYRMNWAATFSLCVAYATNFNKIVVYLILKKWKIYNAT
jgi:hypothetical protein